MRNAALGCLAVILTAGLALGQAPPPEPPPVVPEIPSKEEGAPTEAAAPAETETEHPAEEESCVAPRRFWFRGEYLLWWTKDGRFPALVTSGSPTDPLPGALGQPGTTVLFGGHDNDTDSRSGARFTAGMWLDDHQEVGIEANYFFLGALSRTVTFDSTASGAPSVLARSFFDVLGGRQDASLVAFPGLTSGSVTVGTPSYLQGAEANVVCGLWHSEHARIELLAGFRYLNLHEDLDIAEDDQVDPSSPFLPGAAISVRDHFDTLNNFYGGQVGGRATWRHNYWDLEVDARVALGDTHEIADIAGSTSITPPGQAAQLFNSGFLASASNSGRFSTDHFAVVPEVDVNFGYHVTRWLRVFVGYSFLYWSDVARPGDQVDSGINRHELPTSRLSGPVTGPARPAFSFVQSDYWAQGLNFGMELRY
jgi:hypothetical protein